MAAQSQLIRDWLGDAPYLFAVKDPKKFESDRPADIETATFIAPNPRDRGVFSISALGDIARQDHVLDHAIVVLHPYDSRDLDALASAVASESVARVFVMVWAPGEIVRTWLDGRAALNLHTGTAMPPSEPLMLAAAESIADEEYNGLDSGHGKDAVVQLVRAFAAEGYPLEVAPWLRAYFSAGGSFRHADSIAKLITEMKAGVKHRVSERYVNNIVAVLRERVGPQT